MNKHKKHSIFNYRIMEPLSTDTKIKIAILETENIMLRDELRYLRSRPSDICPDKPAPEYWDDNKVMDFSNWYIDACNLSQDHKFENIQVVESFKNGDRPEKWHGR